MNSLHYYLQRGAFVSEPAILVKRAGLGNQVWTMEKLENKLIDMREMYDDYREHGIDMTPVSSFITFILY